MTVAAIGIGSNQGDAVSNVRAATAQLSSLGTVSAISRLYLTKPWGVKDQADFINAAALVETALEPHELLVALKDLERRLGRCSSYRWGPRVIDLDILYYGDRRINEPDLIVPHPRLLERSFALIPLAEIDSSYRDIAAASGYAAQPGECTALMFEDGDELIARVHRLVRVFEETDLVRLRVSDEADDAIEVRRARQNSSVRSDGAQAGAAPAHLREASAVEVIKADLVGIAHLNKPIPLPGSQLEGDRELAYVEALGIRNPVNSRGGGRLVSILVSEGDTVEYGQPLFEIDRV